MSARKRSSCSMLSTPPWRRYSNAWATAPAGAVESAVISASGSASPPSSDQRDARRARSAARSRSTPSGQPRRPPSSGTTHDARAVEDVVDERLEVVRRRSGWRSGPPGSRRAELPHRVRRGEDLGVGGGQKTEHAAPPGGMVGQPVRGAAFDRVRVSAVGVEWSRDEVGEAVEVALAHGGERDACRASKRRPRCSATQRQQRAAERVVLEQRRARRCRARVDAAPSSSMQRLAAGARRGRGGSRSRDASVPSQALCRCALAQDLVGREAVATAAGRGRRRAARRDSTSSSIALAEHLVAAADAEDRAPRRRVRQRAVEAVGAQPLEVLDGRLGARAATTRSARSTSAARAREAHAHAGLGRERVDVGEVAHPAQAEDGDVERRRRPGLGAAGARARASPRRRSTGPSRHGSTPSVGRPVSSLELLEAGREDRTRRRGTC